MTTATTDLATELVRARQSFKYFLLHHVFLPARGGDGGAGAEQWEWWPVHDSMVADLERERRLCVLKARQISWSSLLAAGHVWSAMFQPAYLGGVISAGQTEASEFLDKCWFKCLTCTLKLSALRGDALL